MQFKIHSEGWSFLIVSLIFTFVFLPFLPLLGIIFLFISIFIFYFFRDPIRSIPLDDLILSPADGIITYIGMENPPLEINQHNQFIKVSIFLNIFNVHVNRIPTSGFIKDIKYIPGKFINASFDKSSNDNEKNILLIEKENKDQIYVCQIAGLIARRIICDLKKNQEVKQGHRFGIIKFGSRVDLYIPKNYKLLVSIGQTVIGGETIFSNPNNIKEINQTIKN